MLRVSRQGQRIHPVPCLWPHAHVARKSAVGGRSELPQRGMFSFLEVSRKVAPRQALWFTDHRTWWRGKED